MTYVNLVKVHIEAAPSNSILGISAELKQLQLQEQEQGHGHGWGRWGSW